MYKKVNKCQSHAYKYSKLVIGQHESQLTELFNYSNTQKIQKWARVTSTHTHKTNWNRFGRFSDDQTRAHSSTMNFNINLFRKILNFFNFPDDLESESSRYQKKRSHGKLSHFQNNYPEELHFIHFLCLCVYLA